MFFFKYRRYVEIYRFKLKRKLFLLAKTPAFLLVDKQKTPKRLLGVCVAVKKPTPETVILFTFKD